MYGALFRIIPGPRWFGVFVMACLALLVVWLCVEFLFPWISSVLPFNELTFDETVTPQPTAS